MSRFVITTHCLLQVAIAGLWANFLNILNQVYQHIDEYKLKWFRKIGPKCYVSTSQQCKNSFKKQKQPQKHRMQVLSANHFGDKYYSFNVKTTQLFKKQNRK